MINLAPPGYQTILSTDRQKPLSSPARMIAVFHRPGWYTLSPPRWPKVAPPLTDHRQVHQVGPIGGTRLIAHAGSRSSEKTGYGLVPNRKMRYAAFVLACGQSRSAENRTGTIHVRGHRRYYYHLDCTGDAPSVWRHSETNGGTTQGIQFELYWVMLPANVPELAIAQGEFLAELGASLHLR